MIDLLVLQPTPFCNLDCSYCYLPDRGNKARMSWEVLEAAARRVVESPYLGDELTFVWHAGEPMVVPIQWYAEAFERVARVVGDRAEVFHSFQTNATLINDDWCAFLKAREVRIGVSYDGPAPLHDRHRVKRDGRGTHAEVTEGMRRLRAAGIPFHVIAVVTADALDQAEGIYRVMQASGCYQVGFNFEEAEGVNATSTLDESSIPAVRAFLGRFLELCRRDPDAPRVRELDHMAAALMAPPSRDRGTQENEPFRVLTVGQTGEFTTWSPELLGASHPKLGTLTLGNVLTDSLEDAAASAHFLALAADVSAGVEACAETCSYFGVCGGGSPSNKLSEAGGFAATETNHCRLSRQAVAEVVLADLERVVG